MSSLIPFPTVRSLPRLGPLVRLGTLCGALALVLLALSRAASETMPELPAPLQTSPRNEQIRPLLELADELAPLTINTLEAGLIADAADGQLDRHDLLFASLIAGGVNDEVELSRYGLQVRQCLGRLKRGLPARASSAERTAIVFRALHRDLLRGDYQEETTEPHLALGQGDYNCLSSTILLACVGRPLGLKLAMIEMPGHAYCILLDAPGEPPIETTFPDWFDSADDPQRQAAALERRGAAAEAPHLPTRELTDLEAASLVYYNRGVHLLRENRFAEAIALNARCLRLDPSNTAAEGNLLAAVNNWAIELCTQRRYADAAQLLRRAQALAPEHRMFDVNLQATYGRWSDSLRETHRWEEAIAVVGRAQAELRQPEWREGLQQAETVLWHKAAVEQLEAGRYQEAIDLLDRGLARLPENSLLAQNRRAAVMQWADEAFTRGDWPEAIRRTCYQAQPGMLHAAMVKNVRYGYDRWIATLREAGKTTEAADIARRAACDPFLEAGG